MRTRSIARYFVKKFENRIAEYRVTDMAIQSNHPDLRIEMGFQGGRRNSQQEGIFMIK